MLGGGEGRGEGVTHGEGNISMSKTNSCTMINTSVVCVVWWGGDRGEGPLLIGRNMGISPDPPPNPVQ
jgi:hypothetical protein